MCEGNNVVKRWLKCRKGRTYKGITYDPSGDLVVDKVLVNTFRPIEYGGKAGDDDISKVNWLHGMLASALGDDNKAILIKLVARVVQGQELDAHPVRLVIDTPYEWVRNVIICFVHIVLHDANVAMAAEDGAKWHH